MFSIYRNGLKIVTLGRVGSKRQLNSKSMNNLCLNKTLNLVKRFCVRTYCTPLSNESAEKEISYDMVTNGDKEAEHKLKVILLEAEVMRQEGKPVPENSFFTEEHWKELLNLPTRSARRKYFEYLFKIAKKKENRKAKKLEMKLRQEENRISEPDKKEESPEDFALTYDLGHNNIFLRFYDTTINQMYNNRLIQAMLFGQKLIVDCGYDENMTKRENINCAKQLMLLFAENRLHNEPFDLHFCNAARDSVLMQQAQKFIPNLYTPSFPLNVHECSYLDLFPKDQLVYLTPHCRQEMTEFNHDTIYIIGAIVDKVNNEPISLAKAKREGLKMAKLPLDTHLQWGSGSGKSLTLNQVTSILNDIKHTGNWEFALRHVPKRKIVEYNTQYNNNSAVSNQRTDRNRINRREKAWVPASKIDFNQLTYNKRKDKQ